jgi:hypothetical protein
MHAVGATAGRSPEAIEDDAGFLLCRLNLIGWEATTADLLVYRRRRRVASCLLDRLSSGPGPYEIYHQG